MDCFRQVIRCIKSPFERKPSAPKGLEIGPPMNFRKEHTPFVFADDDTLTSHSLASNTDKDSVMNLVERRPSTADKLKHHVRRMSIKQPETV